MNKRQKKKRLEREKKEIIKGIAYIENAFTQSAKVMRDQYDNMPHNQDKIYYDFFITGFEYSLKQLALARDIVDQVK